MTSMIIAFFFPFTYNDSIYGLPVLTGGTTTVVVYDQAIWQEAGYDTFPETWDEVMEADAFLKNKEWIQLLLVIVVSGKRIHVSYQQ